VSKKKREQPITVVEGAPEWMVTFGDLMSLLLTFFVLLFSISEIKDQKIFDMIVAFRSEFEIETDADAAFLLDFSEVVELLSTMSRQMPDKAEGKRGKAEERIKHPFGKYASIHRVKDDFHIDIEGYVLFPPGSSEITEEGRVFLSDLSRRLRGTNNRIRVVGSAAPSGPGTDEMLLGFQRAQAVADVLMHSDDGDGILPVRLEVATRGAVEPLMVGDLVDPERRARRDRVVVILTPETVEDLAEARQRRALAPGGPASQEEKR